MENSYSQKLKPQSILKKPDQSLSVQKRIKRSQTALKETNSSFPLFKVVPQNQDLNKLNLARGAQNQFAYQDESLSEKERMRLRRLMYSKENQQYNFQQGQINFLRNKTGLHKSSEKLVKSDQKKIPKYSIFMQDRTNLPPLDFFISTMENKKNPIKIPENYEEFEFGNMGIRTDKYDPTKEYDPITNRQYIHLRPVDKRSISQNLHSSVKKSSMFGNHLFQEGNMFQSEKKSKNYTIHKKDDLWNIDQQNNNIRTQKKFTINKNSRLLQQTKNSIIRSTFQKSIYKKPLTKFEQTQMMTEYEELSDDGGDPNQKDYRLLNYNNKNNIKDKSPRKVSPIQKLLASPYTEVLQFDLILSEKQLKDRERQYRKIRKMKERSNSFKNQLAKVSANVFFSDFVNDNNVFNMEHNRNEKKLKSPEPEIKEKEQKQIEETPKTFKKEEVKEEKKQPEPEQKTQPIKPKIDQNKWLVKRKKIRNFLDTRKKQIKIWTAFFSDQIIDIYLSDIQEVKNSLIKDNFSHNLKVLLSNLDKFESFSVTKEMIIILSNYYNSIADQYFGLQNNEQFENYITKAKNVFELNLESYDYEGLLQYLHIRQKIAHYKLVQYNEILDKIDEQEEEGGNQSISEEYIEKKNILESDLLEIMQGNCNIVLKNEAFYKFRHKDLLINDEEFYYQRENLLNNYQQVAMGMVLTDLQQLKHFSDQPNCRKIYNQLVQTCLDYSLKHNLEKYQQKFRKFL
ncbi:hypothetical protein PPERSA_08560 [Pseudocohnilembus persalinus]|uniref:Uncharacterized protein n=1 Tax=Pseudocohnilembus persalinus TaxID=266149 RepID=A0A0V0R6M3_PSEPJ|nr:hypothetical protein PPERSA_08560 [Pseudocohnilembus persalinus]|eukprot:KRX10157.1 hypothetical protein PPERSA_08560 [Pseudocohnilembus persalinus]